MQYQPDVVIDPDREEILVPRFVQAMKAHARIQWVDLEIECRVLDGLLLVGRKPGQAVGERIGDAEVQVAPRRG